MKVAIGSTNSVKVHALEKLASKMGFTVEARSVPSYVSAQPRSDEETIQGALNRAREVVNVTKSDVGVGLEGGVTKVGEYWFICNWGALVDMTGYECVSSGGHFMLPDAFLQEIKQGKELGEIIQKHSNKNEGAVALLTNGFVTRQTLYEQLIDILFGQYFLRFNRS